MVTGSGAAGEAGKNKQQCFFYDLVPWLPAPGNYNITATNTRIILCVYSW